MTNLKKERFYTALVVWICVLFALSSALTFLRDPALDIRLSELLFENGRFELNGMSIWRAIRRLSMWGFAAFYILIIVMSVISWRKNEPMLGLRFERWMYLVICAITGPLIVANLILKSFVGRPRPREVTEFGGPLEFKQLFEAGGMCVDNCSFVSGEVSSMTMIFASLMFAATSYRWLFALLLIPAWALSAYMRVGQGGHFPSDVLFAGIFMVFIAAILYRGLLLKLGTGTSHS